MKNRCVSHILQAATALLIAAYGCSCSPRNAETAASPKELGEPPVSMKETAQTSYDGSVSFQMQIPEDWAAGADDSGRILIYPEGLPETETEEKILALCPYTFSGVTAGEKDKAAFQALFSGNMEPYEETIKKTFAQQIAMEEKLKELENGGSFLDYLELMSPDPSIPYEEYDIPELKFQYTEYSGQKGRLIQAAYTYTEKGREITRTECFREDLPYLISTEKHETGGLSSEDIALWVADSLKVEEHFPE